VGQGGLPEPDTSPRDLPPYLAKILSKERIVEYTVEFKQKVVELTDTFTAIDSTALSAQLIDLSFLNAVTTPVDQDFSRSTNDVNWLLNTRAATGSKSRGFNTVNGTIEQHEFEDEQDEPGLGTFVSNLPTEETSGLDVNLQALPLPNLTLTGGFLYL
jgi:hypothetical protein